MSTRMIPIWGYVENKRRIGDADFWPLMIRNERYQNL